MLKVQFWLSLTITEKWKMHIYVKVGVLKVFHKCFEGAIMPFHECSHRDLTVSVL